MLKCKIVNLKISKQRTVNLPCKPVKGDMMPINYINEEVDQVVFVTHLLTSEDLNLTGFDLLIYLK